MKPAGLMFSEAKFIESILSYLCRKSFYWHLGPFVFLWSPMFCSTFLLNAAIFVHFPAKFIPFDLPFMSLATLSSCVLSFHLESPLRLRASALKLNWLDWAKEPLVLEITWRTMAATIQIDTQLKRLYKTKYFVKQ